jgi:hypothetical protein
VLNVHCNAAVPPAQASAGGAQKNAPNGATVAVPICALPSENTTVPLGPAALLLWELMLAVNVMGVPELTVEVLGTVAVAVVAFDTVTVSVTAVVTAL